MLSTILCIHSTTAPKNKYKPQLLANPNWFNTRSFIMKIVSRGLAFTILSPSRVPNKNKKQ